MSENLKKLTGKNPQDFESVAYSLINNSDVDLFSELVSKEYHDFDPCAGVRILRMAYRRQDPDAPEYLQPDRTERLRFRAGNRYAAVYPDRW